MSKNTYTLNELQDEVRQAVIRKVGDSKEYKTHRKSWLDAVKDEQETSLCYIGLSNTQVLFEFPPNAGRIAVMGDYSTVAEDLEGLKKYNPSFYEFYEKNISDIHSYTGLPSDVDIRAYQIANTTYEFAWEFGITEEDDALYRSDEELNSAVGEWLGSLYDMACEYVFEVIKREREYILTDEAIAEYINVKGYRFSQDGVKARKAPTKQPA